jgi:hypothetical protein
MSREGFENAMRDRSPRELQTARPLNLHVYEKNTAAIFFGLYTLRQKKETITSSMRQNITSEFNAWFLNVPWGDCCQPLLS